MTISSDDDKTSLMALSIQQNKNELLILLESKSHPIEMLSAALKKESSIENVCRFLLTYFNAAFSSQTYWKPFFTNVVSTPFIC